MKKPEFPKARLIREDFMPEQDPMENYRIKKITKSDGKVCYYSQKKILWFWWNICPSDGYGSESFAQSRVFEDYYNTTLKNKVEYLLPDISKTLSKGPPLTLKKSTDIK